MILIISGSILVSCIILFIIALVKGWDDFAFAFFLIGLVVSVLGLGMLGNTIIIDTKYEYPSDAFIEKNERSIVVVVPDLGNKTITDPAIVGYLSESDTVMVVRKYDSYGVHDETIYVKKNGYKY